MKQLLFICIVFGIIIQGCSPKVRSNLSNTNYGPLNVEQEILVLEPGENIPENSDLIGDLKIGDSGFSTNCGYNTVLQEARITARKSGANIILLTKVNEPDFISTCYRIRAKLYRNLDPTKLSSVHERRQMENQSRLPENVDYAMVYFYRPSNFSGAFISYKIRYGDTVIGRIHNGDKIEYKTDEYGKHVFWAKTESSDSVVVDIKRGQEYFVRCGIKMGIVVGRPELYLMNNHIGIREFNEIKE